MKNQVIKNLNPEMGKEIIQLPTENKLPKRGDRILVWDSDEKNANERIFLAYIEGARYPVVAITRDTEEKFLHNEPFDIVVKTNWKPLPKQEIVELTLEDISNGKGVGVKPELIRIKK